MVDYPPTRWIGVMMKEGGWSYWALILLFICICMQNVSTTCEWLTHVPVVSGSDIVQWMIKNLDIEDQGKTVRGRFWGRGVGDGKKTQHRNSICTSAVSHLCYCVLTLLCVLDLSAFFHEGSWRKKPKCLSISRLLKSFSLPKPEMLHLSETQPGCVFLDAGWCWLCSHFIFMIFRLFIASDMPEFVDYTLLGLSFVWHLLWVITVSWKIHLVTWWQNKRIQFLIFFHDKNHLPFQFGPNIPPCSSAFM